MLPLAACATVGLEGELNVPCLIPHEGAFVARADRVRSGHCPPFCWTCKTQLDTDNVSDLLWRAVMLDRPL